MEPFALIIAAALGFGGFSGIKIIKQGDEALVERLGKYTGKKLQPGLNYLIPVVERISVQQTVRERVIDIPPQQCITRDNVSVTVDAVVYWRILDLEKAYYKVENLQSAMINLVLTQIRAEMGQLSLDETFTARNQINELLLQDLDKSTDPWGVKVTRVELRDLIPAKAVMDAMELQMSAERKKRAAILTSEGERESAVNAAKGRADALLLDAEAQQKSVLLGAEAERQQQILKAQGIAAAAGIIGKQLQDNPEGKRSVEVLLALGYLEMGTNIGQSPSSKVLFMDPGNVPATMEGIKSILGNPVQS
ncbi:SPFH domain-containing protein [Chamaesiphon sp. OTE_75_metabat_556]|uniref:SPFH domain-containing protein n=1 Tax=Chamaesiphon sp. OTE_75_metabat_556 TaxID=2964692 RepID=UPI00286AC33B|nr:SPFH domain-containing protein [Chamaesiphon sp. OTE_75_metabat_556]